MWRDMDFAYALSLCLGVVLWGGGVWLGGRSEPWDTPEFWTLLYPVAIALCAALGFFFPYRPWRWVVALFAMLAIVLLTTGLATGSGLGLLPLGLIAVVVLALPGVLVASLAGWIGRRRR